MGREGHFEVISEIDACMGGAIGRLRQLLKRRFCGAVGQAF